MRKVLLNILAVMVFTACSSGANSRDTNATPTSETSESYIALRRYPALNPKDAFFAFAKLSRENVNRLVENYLYFFNRDNRPANEFERRRIHSETEETIRNGIEKATDIIAKTYSVSFIRELRNYDFNRGGFFVDDMRRASLVSAHIRGTPTSFILMFSNPVRFFSVDEERASQFVKRSYDRRVIIDIDYVIINSAGRGSNIDRVGNPTEELGLVARILRMTVYERDQNGNRGEVLADVIK